MVAGMKECVEALAMKRGISKVEAQNVLNDVLDVMCDKIVDGGVSFKGKFTIKKKLQKGRKGVFNDKEWSTEDKYALSIKVGTDLDAKMNQ